MGAARWERPIVAGAVQLALLSFAPATTTAEVTWGADLSSWTIVERAAPGSCCEFGPETLDAVEAWRRGGGRWVRVRIWNDPVDTHGSRDAAVAIALRATELDLRVLIDLHFSDTWADPGRQDPPATWRDLALDDLADSVRVFTSSVLRQLRDAGATIDAVQIGNEIDGGLLWPTGRIEYGVEKGPDTGRLELLLRAAIGAVRASTDAKVVLHTTAPAAVLLRRLHEHGVDFDVAGLSYYPWWHGDLDELERTLATWTATPVWLVECAYPHTLAWNDAVHNPVGRPDQLLLEFPATPEGQLGYFRALRDRYRAFADDGVLFVFEPAWVSTPGAGSPFENLAWFDFSGRALAVWTVLRED